jgi:YbbR domain-containing protein
VTVKGNQRILDTLESIPTTPINLDGKRKTFNEQVAVDLPDGITLVGENVVLAEVLVALTTGTRQISVVPQYVNVAEGMSVTTVLPESVAVTVTGDPRVINKIGKRDIKLNLDLSGLLSGSNPVTITESQFTLPAGTSLASFSPASLEVVLVRQ